MRPCEISFKKEGCVLSELIKIIQNANGTFKEKGEVLVGNLEVYVKGLLLNLKYNQEKIAQYLKITRENMGVEILRTAEEVENYGIQLFTNLPLLYGGGY